MSFRLFVYYCALSASWAAFVAFAVVQVVGLRAGGHQLLRTGLTGALLGALLAGAVGAMDAMWNSAGRQRLVRVGVCVGVGLVGGLIGSLGGYLLYDALSLPRFLGWALTGTAIGASVGAFDVGRALALGQLATSAWHKVRNGLIGGATGGLVGGLFFVLLENRSSLTLTSLALGFVVLGGCIGLLTGLALVILREAWVRVETGRRAGRELILTRDDSMIGRAEGCDIGLFGDNAVERQHARIVRQGDCYVLVDAGTAGGTYLNDQRIAQPSVLRRGDRIRVGSSVLRFGERRKHQAE